MIKSSELLWYLTVAAVQWKWHINKLIYVCTGLIGTKTWSRILFLNNPITVSPLALIADHCYLDLLCTLPLLPVLWFIE